MTSRFPGLNLQRTKEKQAIHSETLDEWFAAGNLQLHSAAKVAKGDPLALSNGLTVCNSYAFRRSPCQVVTPFPMTGHLVVNNTG